MFSKKILNKSDLKVLGSNNLSQLQHILLWECGVIAWINIWNSSNVRLPSHRLVSFHPIKLDEKHLRNKSSILLHQRNVVKKRLWPAMKKVFNSWSNLFISLFVYETLHRGLSHWTIATPRRPEQAAPA